MREVSRGVFSCHSFPALFFKALRMVDADNCPLISGNMQEHYGFAYRDSDGLEEIGEKDFGYNISLTRSMDAPFGYTVVAGYKWLIPASLENNGEKLDRNYEGLPPLSMVLDGYRLTIVIADTDKIVFDLEEIIAAYIDAAGGVQMKELERAIMREGAAGRAKVRIYIFIARMDAFVIARSSCKVSLSTCF